MRSNSRQSPGIGPNSDSPRSPFGQATSVSLDCGVGRSNGGNFQCEKLRMKLIVPLSLRHHHRALRSEFPSRQGLCLVPQRWLIVIAGRKRATSKALQQRSAEIHFPGCRHLIGDDAKARQLKGGHHERDVGRRMGCSLFNLGCVAHVVLGIRSGVTRSAVPHRKIASWFLLSLRLVR
jgi:hypothetical protein